MMNPELASEISRVSAKRDRWIQQAKTKGPTAAFHVGLVRMNQALEQAEKATEETAQDVLAKLREFDDD